MINSVADLHVADFNDRDLDDTVKYLVAITYQTVTPESAEDGEIADSGFDTEETPCSLADIQYYIDTYGFTEPSSSHITGHDWFSTSDPAQDTAFFEYGDETTYSLHIKYLDGSYLSRKDMLEIAALMGISE